MKVDVKTAVIVVLALALAAIAVFWYVQSRESENVRILKQRIASYELLEAEQRLLRDILQYQVQIPQLRAALAKQQPQQGRQPVVRPLPPQLPPERPVDVNENR